MILWGTYSCYKQILPIMFEDARELNKIYCEIFALFFNNNKVKI